MGSQRRLQLENIINCRDLGGYPCGDRVTKFGRFLRCGIPLTPTSDDIVALMQYGVTTVLDLRGDWEFEMMPSVFRFMDRVSYHHVCLYEINAAVSKEFDGTLEQSYELSVELYKENYAQALRVIANVPDGCVLFHCYFGKDRTGLLCALLMHIAGVDTTDIIADYQVSYTYILSFIEKEKARTGGMLWDTKEENFYSDANSIAALLQFIRKKYGSVMQYIREIGITEAEIERIRAKFFA